MSAIGKGDWVECVDAAPRLLSDEHDMTLIRAGALYRVRAVVADGCGLQLEGVNCRRPTGYWVDRFKPIYRPRSELTADLLRRAKEPLRTETPEQVSTPLASKTQQKDAA